MASAQNLTTFDGALKELYNDDRVEDLTYQNRPLLALMPKSTDFYGRLKPVPIVYGNPQSRSSTFSRALARSQSSPSLIAEYLVRRVKDYGFVTIDNETMEASANDKGAFLKARQVEIDGIFNSLAQSMAQAIVGDGFGVIGKIATGGISTTTITLDDPNTVVFFEVGQELGLVADVDTSAARSYGSSGNGLIVTKVNRSAGTITFGYNVTDSTNGIPAAAAGDYIFVRGDHDEASSPTRLKMSGWLAWCPATDPSSTSFWGVDRTKDVSRLGGLRRDVSLLPIEEGLIDCLYYAGREGADEIDYVFLNPIKHGELVKALGSKVQYVDVMANARIAFRGVEVHGPNRTVKVMSDRTVPYNRGLFATLNTWELATLGKTAKFLNSDGLEVLRMASDDGVECRVGYYGNVVNHGPGRNLTALL